MGLSLKMPPITRSLVLTKPGFQWFNPFATEQTPGKLLTSYEIGQDMRKRYSPTEYAKTTGCHFIIRVRFK